MLNLSWELAYPLGVLVLFGALAWAAIRYHTRNKANDKVTEAATREQYTRPDRYPSEEQGFRDQLKP